MHLVAALQLSAVQVRAILRGAGFAAADTMFPSDAYPDYYFSVAELRADVERVPWPQFVTNDLAQVVAANHAAQTLWEVDFAAELARRSEARLSLLSVAAERHFSERVVNWAECLTVLAGVFKGRPRDAIALEDPGAFVSEVLTAYAENDPAAIPQLIRAWESTPPAARQGALELPHHLAGARHRGHRVPLAREHRQRARRALVQRLDPARSREPRAAGAGPDRARLRARAIRSWARQRDRCARGSRAGALVSSGTRRTGTAIDRDRRGTSLAWMHTGSHDARPRYVPAGTAPSHWRDRPAVGSREVLTSGQASLPYPCPRAFAAAFLCPRTLT